jgi:hypothetical protein
MLKLCIQVCALSKFVDMVQGKKCQYLYRISVRHFEAIKLCGKLEYKSIKVLEREVHTVEDLFSRSLNTGSIQTTDLF